MSLTINGKTFMNIQEAVAWLLANNALPFQCTANYVADTEIAKTTIINPSPAEIKIGSLVLFADGKVGTVSGVTANGFMVGADSTDLSDGVPHIVGIVLNASGHLIFTMSEGDPIDAGLVKELSSLSIDGSQHLIATYNDGSTQDLGAIFQGNVNIAGNLTADSIVENMSGYSMSVSAQISDKMTLTVNFASMVKNGNKLTIAVAGKFTLSESISGTSFIYCTIPSAVGSKLYNVNVGGDYFLTSRKIYLTTGYASGTEIVGLMNKVSNNLIVIELYSMNALTANTEYGFRIEETFLLNDSMI